MDRKSLFIGMGLGAGIALAGMFLGAQGRVNRPDAEFRRLTVEEILVVPRGGSRTMVEIRGNPAHGEINTFNLDGERMVRIAGILRGGGSVATYEQQKPMTVLTSSARGGDLLLKHPAGERGTNSARLTATPQGGAAFLYDESGMGVMSYLAPGANGAVEFVLNQPDGEAGVTLEAASDGGVIKTHDENGEVASQTP